MIKRYKCMLIFSIIYWLIVVSGIALMSVAFQKVPIGSYGLKANHFSPNIDTAYYTPGLYQAGIGFYFILFPSAKQYLLDKRVALINQNLEKVQITYSLIYRLNPNEIYNLYQTMGHDFEKTLIAAANNIISTAFMTLPQNASRVTAQSSIISTFVTGNINKIRSALGQAVAVEAFFINEISFPQSVEKQYEQAVDLADSYQQSYESTMLDYKKTLIQSRSVEQTLSLLENKFKFTMQQAYNQQLAAVTATDIVQEQKREVLLSANYLMRRIWTYYNSTRLVFN